MLKQGKCKRTGNYSSEDESYKDSVDSVANNENLTAVERTEQLARISNKELTRLAQRKDLAERLVKQAATEEGLLHLRASATDDAGKEMFFFFFDVVLVMMISRSIWKSRHMNQKLSEFTTIGDEALAMLLLENMAQDVLNLSNDVAVTRTTSKAKYTKTRKDVRDGKMKGWSTAGIKRYNVLFAEVKSKRSSDIANDLERYVMSKFVSLNDDNHASGNEDDDGYDEALNVEYIEPIDEFLENSRA